ncbi:hypothetical protein XENTR_v10021187 [Xenopus tropicalis]|uniref:Peptidoglycan-recognition protein n=1 Tax=Xenopus tropicalis TaxID=8364 RepID=A0A803JPG3_XENTR|nr:pglyrp1 protein isoform X1 [Xenopus tropicalis]KAE8584994.1 hypothetical protein XENTR_v10021187 [Xenopus tropicalis]
MMWVFIFLTAFCALAQGCPKIISRSSWGGVPSKCQAKLPRSVKYVIIHHTAGASCNSESACKAQARNIQNFHMKSNGWCDTGYNFLIGEDGQVYEGRGWETVGAHAKNYNFNSIGISFMGTFTNRAPNTAAQKAAKDLISCGVAKKGINSDYTLKGHRDVSATECPGTNLYNLIKNWPNFKA